MNMLIPYRGEFTPTGVIAVDVRQYLGTLGYPKTAQHCTAVAAEAKRLAERFQSNPHQAELAGYLHDISVVIPDDKRLDFAESMRVEVLVGEVQFPMILHQKLSVVIAREIFLVADTEVLGAIGCHTTLKAGASLLDKVVFLADKIAWDQTGNPPFLYDLLVAMDESLDAAVLVYLNYLWERRSQLKIIHPWLIEARDDLLQN